MRKICLKKGLSARVRYYVLLFIKTIKSCVRDETCHLIHVLVEPHYVPGDFFGKAPPFSFQKGEMSVFLHLDVPPHVPDMYTSSQAFAFSCSTPQLQ